MKSTRKFLFTCAFAAAAILSVATTSSAQGRGMFTLTHDVVWQGTTVPAGKYVFSLESRGPSQLLTLSKRDGARTGFMLLVNNTSSSTGAKIDRLVLVPRAGRSFVQAMELPEFGLTLQFAVPEGKDKEMALAGDNPVPTRLR